MLKYVDEKEYQEISGSESIPENFEKLAIEASSYIDLHTFGRIDEKNIPEQVKYATCSIINLINKANLQKEEIGNLKSQNIEGWQETYSTPAEIDNNLKNDKINVLKLYLSNVVGKDGNFLLYRGV